jgi:hypothetical protein
VLRFPLHPLLQLLVVPLLSVLVQRRPRHHLVVQVLGLLLLLPLLPLHPLPLIQLLAHLHPLLLPLLLLLLLSPTSCALSSFVA